MLSQTMNIDSPLIQQYLKNIEKQLRLTNSQENTVQTMDQFRESIDVFFEENPSATFDDFKEHFGDIDDFKETVLYETEASVLEEKINKSKLFKRIMTLILILVILLFAIKMGLYIKSYIGVQNATIYKEIIYIE